VCVGPKAGYLAWVQAGYSPNFSMSDTENTITSF